MPPDKSDFIRKEIGQTIGGRELPGTILVEVAK